MNHKRVAIVVRQHRRFLYLLVAVSLVLGVIGSAQVLPVQRVQAQGGVTVDGSVSSGTADDVSTIDVDHTTGTGADRLMLVGVSWNCGSTDRTISSVTFTPSGGGGAITLDPVITQQAGTQLRYSAIYRWPDDTELPSGQAGTVTVTFSGSVSNGIMAGVANFAGVNQTTPLRTPGGEGSGSNDTAPTVTLTGLNGDELVFDNLFQGAGASSQTLTVGPGQTVLWYPDYIANLRAAASIEQATGDSVTMSWTASSASYWAIAAVPINPAPVGPTHDLTMAVSPSGGGSTDPPEGVHTYPQNDVVDITATPNVGYVFTSWGGDCSGSGACQVTMDADKSVTANFTATNYDLTMAVDPSGGGTTTPAVGGPYSYGAGAVADISATANFAYAFDHWTGDGVADVNAASTTVTMDGNKTVTAHFAVVPTYELTMAVDPAGTGTTDPAVSPPSHTYEENTVVDITATANVGYRFDHWTGDVADVNAASTTVTVDGDKTVTANFAEGTTIALDGDVSSGTADGVSSISFSHTTGTGMNRLMLVGVSANSYGSVQTISSVTFNYDTTELPLTEVGSVENEGGRLAAIYGLVDPPSGQAGTVVVTFSGSVGNGIVAGAANFAGVDQDTPFGTYASNTGTDTTPTVNVATEAKDVVFDTVFLGAGTIGTLAAGGGQMDQWNETVDRVRGAASTEEATGVSVTMSWAVSGGATSRYWAIAAVPINPAATAPTCYALALGHNGNGTDPEATPANSTGCGAGQYVAGETINLSGATPDTGWEIGTWYGTSAPGSSSLTMPASAHSAGVNYVQTCYALTLGHTGNGTTPVATSSAVCPAGNYAYDETVSLSGATPDLGWGIASWYGTGDDTSTADTNSVTMPASAHSAGVNYLRLLGDVDLSGDVDSTDALIVLTADAGLPTTAYCPMNYGDVNGDGVVNSTDALIMLTYDVELPVGGLPVGQPVAEPVLVTQPPGCGG